MKHRREFYSVSEKMKLVSYTVRKYCDALASIVKNESTYVHNSPETRDLFRVGHSECFAEIIGRKSLHFIIKTEKKREYENSP
jgi:hypothetical protein